MALATGIERTKKRFFDGLAAFRRDFDRDGNWQARLDGLRREGQLHTWWLWRRDGRETGRHLSPIMLRILAVNVMALAILVGSLLYLGRYQDRIVSSELEALLLESRITASAVAEDAAVIADDDRVILSPLLARPMVRRMAETTRTRARLFDVDDAQLADSQTLLNDRNRIQIEDLDGAHQSFGGRVIEAFFDMVDLIPQREKYPLYQEQDTPRGSQYEIVRRAMQGIAASQVWALPEGGLLLTAAVPVMHSKQVLGTVMLSRSGERIDAAIRAVRADILQIFMITLMITILFSLYLARAIARPIRLLAAAAEGLRMGQMQNVGLAGTANLLNRDAIPDMAFRNDEIGDLSEALRGLTYALSQRIGAIENFAADVAHEIKNPLTSLRSAVETAERVQDPALQRKLMLVIHDDVARLDRLISDISNASRLDAELSRAETVKVDTGRLLEALVDYYHLHGDATQTEVILSKAEGDLSVVGVEARLVQVFQNLVDNAISFSPPGGRVVVSVRRVEGGVRIDVEDDGPGIPENKLAAVFDRFYTERPKAEKFGTHSGLGLSISKQIVEAHRGAIRAENRRDRAGNITGARFVVELPAAE